MIAFSVFLPIMFSSNFTLSRGNLHLTQKELGFISLKLPPFTESCEQREQNEKLGMEEALRPIKSPSLTHKDVTNKESETPKSYKLSVFHIYYNT